MTISEAAKRLNVDTSTLYHQIAARKLKAHRMGRSWYVTEGSLEAYRAAYSRKGKAA